MHTSDPSIPNASDPAMPALPRIAGYRVVRVLGRGGMAVVYLAVQESLDREVAIKVMWPAAGMDEAQAERFEHEARIIAKLEHPGIVGIHEVGRTSEGQLYYVMPYLARGDLGERDYRDDEDGLIALLRTLLDALGYAHARGIVHRDVKAENVLFNNADQPQLADFGIALSRRGRKARVTSDGLALGSGGHMPPEQARGAVVDGRADLYSLGVLTYELLTGHLPFHADDALGLAVMHAHDPVPRLPGEKAHWQPFIDQAMEKSPERRFRNAQAMSRALERVHQRLHPATGVVGWLLHPAWRRPGVLVALGALLAVVLAVLLWPRPDAQTQEVARPSLPVVLPLDAVEDPAIGARLDEARAQLAAGALLLPAGANAAESFLDVLKADPYNAEARAGLDSIIAALDASLVDHVAHATPDATRELQQQAVLFADLAQLRTGDAFLTLQTHFRTALADRIRNAIDTSARDTALAWLPLARESGLDVDTLATLERDASAMSAPGDLLQDDDGPALSFVPASVGAATVDAAFAMMRNEVSRAEFARFAGNREATRCRNRLSPLQLFDRRDWRDPGFGQGGNEPVVCVSFADAQAYARWLSERTGQRYRLPTAREWRHAAQLGIGASACTLGNVFDRGAAGSGTRLACDDGHSHTAPSGRFPANVFGLNDLAGNASEWTLDCGSADNAIARRLEAETCPRRAVVGSSWRDGPGPANPAPAMLVPERGYDDVGFRLLREL